VTEGERAVGNPLDGGQQQPLGGELEVHGALGEDPVLELERPRVPGQHVGQDALDLDACGVVDLALVDEAALLQHLGQRAARAEPGVHLLELVAGDAADLDEDLTEVVARVVRGAEKDAARAEEELLRMHRAADLQGSRGPVAMQVHEEVGKRRRLDVPADRERFRHPSSPLRVVRDAAPGRGQNLQES
jgi:hypothetical protein